MRPPKDTPNINGLIKRVAAYRGMTIQQLGEKFNLRYGTKYSYQSFVRKLNNETGLSFDDVQRFGEILGFTISVSLNEGNQLPICQSS